MQVVSLQDATSIDNVYAVAMQKGGVGKTVGTISLAAAAARKGNSVLIVDMDPQGSATYYFKYLLKSVIQENLYHLLVEGKLIAPIQLSNLISLLPAHPDMAAVQNLFPLTPTTQDRVNMVLARYLSAYAPRYDYVIIDCPPSLNLLTKNALGAARHLIIPCSTDEMSIDVLPQILQTVKDVKGDVKGGANPQLEILCILPTLFSKVGHSSSDMLTALKDVYSKDYPIYSDPVRRLDSYKKAVADSIDVGSLDVEQGDYWDAFFTNMILPSSALV